MFEKFFNWLFRRELAEQQRRFEDHTNDSECLHCEGTAHYVCHDEKTVVYHCNTCMSLNHLPARLFQSLKTA